MHSQTPKFFLFSKILIPLLTPKSYSSQPLMLLNLQLIIKRHRYAILSILLAKSHSYQLFYP